MRMDHDPLDTEAGEKAQQESADKGRHALRVEKDDLVWITQTKRGRRFVLRMLERAGVWQLSFDTNALKMAFNEGRRNEGLALTAKMLELCPENYRLMLTELKDE